MKEDMEEKLDNIMANKEKSPFSIPYIVFENSKVRAEKRERRNFFTVIFLIVLLVITNISWLLYTSQFTKVTTTSTVEQTSDTGSNTSIIGDLSYGKPTEGNYNNYKIR